MAEYRARTLERALERVRKEDWAEALILSALGHGRPADQGTRDERMARNVPPSRLDTSPWEIAIARSA